MPGVSPGTTNIEYRSYGGASGSVIAITMMNDAIEANDENHFSPLMTQSIAVLDRRGGEHLRVGAALRLGHREAGHDPVVEQRLEVALLQLGRAVVGEDLAVAGVGRLRAEHDRRALGPAEDLVEQRQLHLAVAGTAEVRAEVGGPQAALLDDLLQRRDERLADRVVEVVRLLDDQIDRLAFRAHELVDPGELLRPLGVGREVPRHRKLPSFRQCHALAVVPRPRRWRG